MYPSYPTQPGYPNQPNPPFGAPSGYGMPPDPNQYSGASQYGAPSYPSQPGYPPQSGDYPSQSGGYPPQSGGYPPQSGGYPPGGYPPQSGGYPPQSGGYPPPAGQPGFGGGPYDQNNSSFPPYQPGPNGNTNPSLSNFGYPSQPPANIYPPINSNHGFDQFNAHGAYNPTNQPGVYPGSNFGQSNYIEGTVKPYQPFNPTDDATKLYKAMKGFGTDEKVLIDILCRRTYNQRQEIAMCYKTSYGKDLLENLKSELKGNLELVFKALMKSPSQLEAHDLKKAIDGAGTDEEALIDVMCTKTNAEMIELKQAYRQMYNRDLERDVGGDVSGYFKRLIVSLAAAHRSDNPPDFNKAIQQANELYSAGAKSLGTDEVTFNRIFASESFPHLRAVFDEYYKKTGSDIEKAVKSEMSGYVEKAFCAIIGTARNPAAYYAQRLHDAMIGAGTKDRTLVRIIVLRCEKDMVQIKSEFQRRYGKTLESFIKDDCTGDYERALRCLIGDNTWR